MSKNDFDIDFDFEEEYGFDPKAFLDAEEYDADVDLGEFSDEELGLSDPVVKTAPAAEEPDLEEMDFDDLLDLQGVPQAEEKEEEELTFTDEEIDVPDFFDDDFKKEPVFPEEDQAPEVNMDDTMIFPDKNARAEQPAEEFQADFQEESFDQEMPYDEEYDEEERPRRKMPSMPKINLPKITLPKIAMPNIFAKFYELYFAPVVNKGVIEEPVDPNAPRRRRRKSKVQIFKEVYLPPIIVCLSVVLILSFVIGSVSNVIDQRQAEKDKQQAALQESENAAIQQEEEYERLLKEAEVLAAGYDYEGAITLLDSFSGDIAQYQDMVAKRSEYANAQVSLVEHKDPSLIPNLSFHVLMADPERAFSDTDDLAGSYNKNFVTVNEFTKILQQLYDNGFVLVDFDSFCVAATGVDGSVQYYVDPIYLPSGKKPVMLTQTMVNYFEYMIDSNGDHIADAGGDGFASKLVVQNGSIEAEYVDMNSETHIGNYDFVPILEDFIAEHPDFSYRGARATLAVTGSQGIFGYRCNTSYVSNVSQSYYDEQVAGAKEIVQALRDKGYTLACFSYDNKDYRQLTAAQITADLQQWTTQIVPIIGEVDTFVFARASNIQDYTGAAFNVMFTSGFRKFVSNGTSPWAEVNSTYIRQNRLMVTGQNMVWYSKQFTDLGLFDPNLVLDLQIRGNVPN